MEGYIKLFRSLLDWEWYSDINTRLVFIHLLLNANWEESGFKGIDIPKGGLVIGRKQLAESVGISEQSVRTALEHLKSTNEITIKSTNKFSVITIVNWEKYQCVREELTNESTNNLTNNQPTTNQQLTTEEEYKNIRIKEINNIRGKIFVPPTIEEVKDYCHERNNNIDPETFINFYESKGWYVGKNKMKDWKAAIRTWERNRKEPKNETAYETYKKTISAGYDFEALEREANDFN